MLWLLSGPSCAGKSTLARDARRAEVIGAPPSATLVFPVTFDPTRGDVGGNQIYHYNILRRADDAYRRGLVPDVAECTDFPRDPPWSTIRSLRRPSAALVLVAPRSVLLARMATRRTIEPSSETMPRAYPREHWQALVRSIDLNAVYRGWCDELARAEIPFRLVDSTDDAYRPMSVEALGRWDLNRGEAPPDTSFRAAPTC